MKIPEGWEEALLAEMIRRFGTFKKWDDDYLPHDDTQIGVEFAIDFIKTQLAAAPTPPAQDNPWQQAVLHECAMVEGCYKEADPAGTLTCLINWHVLNERDHAPAQEDEPMAWQIEYTHPVLGIKMRKLSPHNILDNFIEESPDAVAVPLYTRPQSDTQEDEPFAFHDTFNNRLIWPDQICTSSEGRMKPLYTRPQSDNLREAAEEFVDLYRDESLGKKSETFNNLRRALESK